MNETHTCYCLGALHEAPGGRRHEVVGRYIDKHGRLVEPERPSVILAGPRR